MTKSLLCYHCTDKMMTLMFTIMKYCDVTGGRVWERGKLAEWCLLFVLMILSLFRGARDYVFFMDTVDLLDLYE